MGANGGAINNTYSSATVSTASQYLGGLVGSNTGSIGNSYSTGSVSGSIAVGGLVGYNPGTITDSYSSGTATGTSGVGGLVGENYAGTISSAYSTGSAMLTGSSGDAAGGLVGDNANGGIISNSFSSAAVSAGSGSSYVGGLARIERERFDQQLLQYRAGDRARSHGCGWTAGRQQRRQHQHVLQHGGPLVRREPPRWAGWWEVRPAARSPTATSPPTGPGRVLVSAPFRERPLPITVSPDPA